MHYLTFLKISTSVRQGFFEINKEVRIRDFMLNKKDTSKGVYKIGGYSDDIRIPDLNM